MANNKWALTIKVLPFLILVGTIKLALHFCHFEPLGINPFFTSIVAATIFLIGFLSSGVMSDYKESEKLPTEIASALESIQDEVNTIIKGKKFASPECQLAVKNFILFYSDFLDSLLNWFNRKERTRALMDKISALTEHFTSLEEFTQVPFIAKMKVEQNSIRKIIGRIHTVRETDFIVSAYVILEILAVFLILGMLLIKIEPFYEAIFFTLMVSFVVIYMILLIKDMDNPFDYVDGKEQGTEVSLKPIRDFQLRFEQKKSDLGLE
ncbi:MAG: hypothetical protein K9K75_02770 [Deltaproteobacteria bacterium]|nr:hypothetical protein [Deltaproteobacteria bacterium]